MSNKLLFRLAVLVTAMMCALGAAAAEAYACYTPSNTTLTFYYDNLRNSRTGTTYDLNTGDNDTGWDTDETKYDVTNVVFDPSFAGARPTTTYDWFYEMGRLHSITGISYLNTSEVTDMSYMFQDCIALTSLDVSHFNTANVTRMNSMFKGCECLMSLDVSNFNTAKVTAMKSMFQCCTCLTSLDLTSFNTANVTDMDFMFYESDHLTSLDLTSFNTAKVTSMYYMFKDCSDLATIYVGDNWSTAAVANSDYMFSGCTSLVGGRGTAYNSSNPMDKTYAHIDGGPSNPGYFTKDPNAPVAYACYHAGYSTLTFYYDNQKSSRPGEIFDLNEGSENPDWYDNGWSYEVTKVVFDPSFADARPTTTVNWFAEMYELTSVEGIENLNTSEVTDMGGMFWECGSLPYVDVSGFDTHNVTNMNSMFAECYELTGLDVSGFDTRNVTSMESMFGNCSELTFLDVSGFNTAKVTSMYNLFGGCGLTSLDLHSFDTHNVTNMCYMFSSCSELKTIYVGEGWTTAGVTVSDEMFYYCLSIVGGQGTTYDANHTDAAYAHIDDGPSNPGYFTDINSLIEPEAYACKSSDTTLTFYYDKLRSKRPYRTYDLNSDNNYPEWYHDYYSEDITTVVFDPSFAAARPTTTYYWFAELEGLSSISGIEYLNTSDVVNMQGMFFDCSSLTSLDVSHFNTDNVTDMSFMFTECHNLSSLDVSSFNTDSVTTMGGMFFDCFSLTSLDVSNFNTENVTDMSEMFRGCELLTSLDVSSFNTDSVTTMRGMFFDCFSLTSLDVSNFNTENVTNMSQMFRECFYLTSLDLSNFNTENVTDMSEMFNYCYYMETIYVSSGWSTASVTESESMFNYCSNIVGGQGTTYDANHVDKTYAHIDGGPSNPGYFTAKNASQRGDVNGDNDVTIADVSALIDYLLTGDPTGVNLAAANCNGDSDVSIADVSALIDYLLTGSW